MFRVKDLWNAFRVSVVTGHAVEKSSQRCFEKGPAAVSTLNNLNEKLKNSDHLDN